MEVEGKVISYEIPVLYKFTDAAKGEQKQPFAIVPDISIQIDEPNYMFVDGQTRDILVSVSAERKNVSGKVFADLPVGWKSNPESMDFNLEDVGDNASFNFSVTPTDESQNGELRVKAGITGNVFSRNVVEIKYDHIPTQIVLQPAKTNLVKLDMSIKPRTIAYIMGSGDEIPELLQQLGYKVDLLSDDKY